MSLRQAVLLVGGRGTRVWPLTATRPKGLLPVAGVPFIELQLAQLAAIGIEDVVLAIGTSHLAAWDAYATARSGAPAVRLSVEHERLDTAGPVVEVLDSLDERFLVLNGDVVLDGDLGGFAAAAPVGAAGTLALVEVEDPSAYGVVVTRSDATVDRFVEKPAPGTAPANTVSAGIYVLHRRALERRARGALSFERVVFPALVEAGELAGIVVAGHWLDIGTGELYLSTHDDVYRGATPLVTPAATHEAGPGAVVDGELGGSWAWVGERAVIGHGAAVEESVVMPGARIGDGALVRRSVIGWDAVIEPGVSVTGHAMIGERSIVGAGCELAGGALVAPDAVLPAGSITFSPPS